MTGSTWQLTSSYRKTPYLFYCKENDLKGRNHLHKPTMSCKINTQNYWSKGKTSKATVYTAITFTR